MDFLKKIATNPFLVVAAMGVAFFLGYKYWQSMKAEKATTTETAGS